MNARELVRIQPSAAKIDFKAEMERLKGLSGPEYWRALNALAGSGAVDPAVFHELPWRDSDELPKPMERRDFFRLMAASLAMAGLTGCTKQPIEKIVPWVTPPEGITQGKPLYFATAMPSPRGATGLLVKSHMGRPIKIEGNPRHPASLGGSGRFEQASILGLYDPDRSQTITYRGVVSNWIIFLGELGRETDRFAGTQGAGLRILTEPIVSPTLAAQMHDLLAKFPAAKWQQWDPAGSAGAYQGAMAAFGQPVNCIYQFAKAKVVLAADSDFLACGAGSERYARDFVQTRGANPAAGFLSRLYAVESTPSNTGAMADHRLPVRSAEVELILRGVAQALGVAGGANPPAQHARWVQAVAKDLQANKGAAVVVPGDYQPGAVHALAHAINASLGAPVSYTDPVQANPVDPLASLTDLVGEMRAGKVETLVILGGNPVYDAPADLDFAGALNRVPLRIRMGLYDDETSRLCHWHIPETHYLESWSDARAFDGTASIVQPLIAPLYNGRSPHVLLNALLGNADRSAYDTVRAFWQGRRKPQEFDREWRRWLHDGVIPDTAFQPRAGLSPRGAPAPAQSGQQSGYEIVFRPDPTVWDGRFANNGWLQELPKPMSKITWDNAVYVSPNTAKKLSIENEDLVEFDYRGRKLKMPVWIVQGQADDSFTVFLGYGRTRAGRVGDGTGFNTYALRRSDAHWFGNGLQVRKAGGKYQLACTQRHVGMDGRYPVRYATAAAYEKDRDVFHKHPFFKAPPRELSLYPDWEYPGYAWGMAIDLNACVGCNACVVACNAENNIPIVGKDETFRGHHMLWLRVDQYFEGDPSKPLIFEQPLMCVHCENAPCELVCPVNATVHSQEGLNEMVYNRCVGTRYCSNNCPYKVRRFNWFLYADWYTPSLKLMRNPDVSVRSRGVMEKCTYCVQRIQTAKIQAEEEDRRIRDGEIQTACAQACPARAIVFGDINDKNSQVSKLQQQRHSYGLLAELNTRPRTTYVARLRNPNPELEAETQHA